MTEPHNDRPADIPGIYDSRHPERGGFYTVGGAEGRKMPWPPEAVAEIERLNRSYDSYMRALAESIGVDMEEYALPSAHGNDRLRWAVLIQQRIGELQKSHELLERLRRSLDGPCEGIDKAMAEVDAHLWPTSGDDAPGGAHAGFQR